MAQKKRTKLMKAEPMNIGDLLFDAQNPRLAGDSPSTTQDDILTVLWKEMAVDEIAYSVAENGYFEHEPLFAEPSGDKFVVIEGNRRLAAVKLLVDATLRKEVGAKGLPKITAAQRKDLSELPVIVCERNEIWSYVGFKHVNGPQVWASYSKAQYIAWVHNELKISLDDVALKIGDRHATVKRLYRAMMVIEQAEAADVFQREDRKKKHFSFSHLYTGLEYKGIQKYTGISPDIFDRKRPVPKKRVKNLGELCVWLYGSESQNKEPVVKSQNPDLRVLDEVLRSPDGTAALRRGLPLEISRDIGKGDTQLFREALVLARQYLQDARAKLLTGYNGEKDVFRIADAVVDDMRRRPSRRSR